MSCYEYMTASEIEANRHRVAQRDENQAPEKKKSIFLRMLIAIGILTVSSGCATITNGTEQTLNFKPQPGQVCYISRSGEAIGAVSEDAPTITIRRSSESLQVDCGEAVETLEPKINAAGYTSIFWLDFGLVDYITGAMWEIKQ